MIKLMLAAAKKVTLDRGSRKYSLCLICLGCLVGGLAIGGALPVAAAGYSIFVGGVVGLYGVYCSGNVAAKWSPTAKDEGVTVDSPGPNA